MAQIVVERSAIADFLDELPGLLMQYKQMQWAMEERALDREERKAATTQGILLKEYYDKKAEVRQTEAMFDKYSNLSPSDVSPGGADIVNFIDEQNNIDMDAITQNLDALGSYQSGLESSLGELRGQAQILQEMQLDYAGPEGVLEQDEYEEFRKHALTAMDEGGLGWTTTAGADVGFYETDVTTRQIAARNQAKDMKADLEGDAAGQYEILRGVFTATEDYDADDMIDALTYEDQTTGFEVEPSEEVIGAIQRLAGQSLTYDNFMDNLAAFPSEGGGDYIRAELITNPQINLVFNDLQKNYKAINVLDNKLAGINDAPIETNLNIFIDEISNVTNPKVLFGLYDEAIKGQDIDFENDPFFDAVEAQLGVIDASEAYLKHKGLSTEVVPLSEDAQQLTTEITRLNKEITALSQFYGATSDEVTERKMELLRFEIQLNKITQAERVEKSQAEMDTTITELSSLTGLSEEEIVQQVEEIRAAGVPWEGVRTEILGGWIPGKMKTTRLGGGQGRMY